MPVAPVVPKASPTNPVWGGALATPWRRLGGDLIDGLVLVVAMFVILGVCVLNSSTFQNFINTQNPTPEQLEQVVNDLMPVVLILFLAQGVYYVLFIHLRGQTPGKMAVGIRVVQIEDGLRPSWGRAVIRLGVPVLAVVLPGAGLAVLLVYAWMLWDKQRQGLQDKAARTVVVRTSPA